MVDPNTGSPGPGVPVPVPEPPGPDVIPKPTPEPQPPDVRAAALAGSAKTCLPASSGLVSSLKSGLKAKAKGKLGTPRVVKSRAHVTNGPNGFDEGVYFVSARVRGFGIATWAADAEAFRTGGGFIVDIGPVARRVSVLGIDIPVSTLRGWGLTESTHGYAASRSCIKTAG